MTNISSNKTIAKNTLFLYFRMMFTMVISLYTSRVNLSVLGIEDNGIYQVVGGVISVFAFLNNSLSGATSRFLTYEMGRGDKRKLKDTFISALNIHIIVALIVFVLSETVGLWFLDNKLVIPEDRINAAKVVYQLSVLSSMLAITQVPFNASIIAHEKMNAFAYMSILDVSLKLLACYLLYIIPFDKLITYGILIFIVSFSVQFCYIYYCVKNFEECKWGITKDSSIIKPLSSFSGWNLFGNFGVMARGYGVNLVMNMFFGPAINSACGFSTTVGNAVTSFSENFLTAIRPSIVKSNAIGDYIKMESLMINASKYSFSLLLLLSTPFIFESTLILKLWLKTPPVYTDVFCKLQLMYSLFSSLCTPVMYAVQATGHIKFTSLVNGSLCFMVLPLTYLFLSLGYSPLIPFYINLSMILFLAYSNIYSLKKSVPSFDFSLFFRKAIIPSLIMAIIVLSITYIARLFINFEPFVRFMVTCFISSLTVSVCVYLLVLTGAHRIIVNNKLKALLGLR